MLKGIVYVNLNSCSNQDIHTLRYGQYVRVKWKNYSEYPSRFREGEKKGLGFHHKIGRGAQSKVATKPRKYSTRIYALGQTMLKILIL